ncbi:MAG: hypothetical protein Q9M91_06700 [Candidatus Dojkabacteria bacterium]|nr:hypothetical protein [Candidatus Dojkabacteria bacterium]
MKFKFALINNNADRAVIFIGGYGDFFDDFQHSFINLSKSRADLNYIYIYIYI